MLKIVEKINLTFSAAFLVCSLGFVSCATTKGIADTTVYETVTDAVTNSRSQSLTLGKKVKAELTETNAHVKDYYIEKVPVAIHKIEISEAGNYDLTLKSIPNGLMAIDQSKKSAVIPNVYLYDSDLNLVQIKNLYGSAKAPTNTESFLFEVTGKWTIENPGTYYFVIKPDMSSDTGITLYINVIGGGSGKQYYKRTRYSKYKLLIKKN